MSNNSTDVEKQARTKTVIIVVATSVMCLLVGYFIGQKIGYNKGFDKGVGWE